MKTDKLYLEMVQYGLITVGLAFVAHLTPLYFSLPLAMFFGCTQYLHFRRLLKNKNK